jgi:hypothetical protein
LEPEIPPEGSLLDLFIGNVDIIGKIGDDALDQLVYFDSPLPQLWNTKESAYVCEADARRW